MIFQVSARENRESGEIPGRTRHCEREQLPIPLQFNIGGRGNVAMILSQETCLGNFAGHEEGWHSLDEGKIHAY
ncbi:MAG: hypothetical protein PWP31_1790 [Clostridia bacterium]|nr:hypothetical protein [Clostridia bacterium]